MAEKKLTKVVTPVGELHYVQIEGQGKEKYDAEKGYEYVATLYLSTERSTDLRKKLDDEIGDLQKGESLKSRGYRQLMKDKDGKIFTPTSKNKDRQEGAELLEMYSFIFKTGTKFGDGKPKVIGVFDSGDPSKGIKPKRVNLGGKKIGNGSEGAISGQIERSVYKGEVSCSLYLSNIQLTKFIEYEDDAGFDAQDGEFQGSNQDDESGFSAQSDAGESTGDAEAPKSRPRI